MLTIKQVINNKGNDIIKITYIKVNKKFKVKTRSNTYDNMLGKKKRRNGKSRERGEGL